MSIATARYADLAVCPSVDRGYRPEIDGLRALAVLPVLLYHAGVAGFGGGFIGVDIFFVISGFLITGIIAREVDAGTFSILQFYERRARRILPALCAMIAATLVIACWLYLPGDFEGVPLSALAAIGFLANVWFFSQAGYFQSEAETMPLLHTWSLGVEEQFYIILPILLLLVGRYAPRLSLPAMIALTGLSFLWAVRTQALPDGFAFYLLPPRAWELLAGALLALGAVPEIRHRLAREIISLAGLAAIIGAVTLYSLDTVFPGVTALVPVFGAAALIHCAHGTAVGKVLAMRLPVAIGLISYSLYLWHWPLIVFAEYRQGVDLRPLQSAAVIAVSLAAAWLSWRYVEQPFRDHRRFSGRRVLRWSAAGMIALSGASLLLASLGGWTGRFPAASVQLAAAKTDFSPVRNTCLPDQPGADLTRCTLGAGVDPASVIWGDSHGIELGWALGKRLEQKGQSIAQRTLPSCPPAIGYTIPGEADCARFNTRVMEEIERDRYVKTVYLAGFWANERYRDTGVLPRLDQAITRLLASGKQVVLIGAVPRQKFEVPRRLAIGGPATETATLAHHMADTRWIADSFPQWRAQGVRIIDPAKVLVKDGKTVIVADGHPLYLDSHHLSVTGAEWVLDAYPDL